MDADTSEPRIDRLPIEDRLRLVEEIWDSIAADATPPTSPTGTSPKSIAGWRRRRPIPNQASHG